MTNTTAPALSLHPLAARLNTELGTTFYVENIGGGVMALVDYAGLTLTVNGGQRDADTDLDLAHVLVCQDGERVANGHARSAADVVELLRAYL